MNARGTVKPVRHRNGSKLYIAQDERGHVLGTYVRYSTARLVASGALTPNMGKGK